MGRYLYFSIMPAARKKSSTRLFFWVIILAIGGFGLFKVFGPATGTYTQGEFLYVHTGSDYEHLKQALKDGGFISDMRSFELLARVAELPKHVHPGKYLISKHMSNYNIIRLLRSGRQTPIKLVINKLRTKQDLINTIAGNLEADSLVLKQMFSDPVYLAQFGLDTNTVMCAIIPDTYDFYWNITADKAFKKIEKNYVRFWDNDRKKEAQDLGLSPAQVTTVASIVEEETNKADDKPKIASVYLNRLHQGMKLQADPTVKFAVNDFTIRRIAGAMLQNTSPYNTYMYTGLPPGPICTPTESTIDAVLESPKTNYLYFCAKEDFSGYSNFAATYDEQLRNARLYQQALDAKNIH